MYEAILPTFMQTAVGNFFGNLGDVWTAVNNFLQGKAVDGVTDVMRVAINSTLGLGGLINIASEAGIPKHKEDFGQTLGKWGVGAGPYIVLPLLGSSTLRDSFALPLDFKGDLWRYKQPPHWRNAGSVVRLVDQRAAVLNASNLIEEAALDRYEFVRDAFLQRRESKVNDNGDLFKGSMSGQSFDIQAQVDRQVIVNVGVASSVYESVTQSTKGLEDEESDNEEHALSIVEGDDDSELDDLM